MLFLFAVNSPLLFVPLLAYGGALAVAGLLEAIRQRRVSSCLGVPLCLVMLHTSFSIGLLDGLVRKGRLPSDR